MALVRCLGELAAALFKDTPPGENLPSLEEPAAREEILKGKYRIKRFICGTLSSNIFLADGGELGDVALKYCKYDVALKREIAASEKIAENGGHENIVSPIRYFADRRLIVIPYYAEGDLYRYAVRRRGLDLQETCKIVRDVGKGLQFMHDLGMVHRDIKTANILLSYNKKGGERKNSELLAKLADFGSCWFEGIDHLETPGKPVGTMVFSAPEDLYSSTKSTAADVYSLGLVIYEMLIGGIVYSSLVDIKTRFQKRFLSLPENEKIPPRIMRVIQGACEIKPENRPKLSELVDDFERAANL